MLTISINLSDLSHVQRRALSAFVLDDCPEIESGAKVRPVELSDVIVADRHFLGPLPTVAALSLEEVELTPEQAFAPAIPAPTEHIPVANVDKSGLPWDERIHSSSKNFTADGNWRKKRGVDDALIAEVEGQLRRLMSIPSPAAAVPAPPVAVGVPPPPAASLPLEVENGREAYLNFIKVVSKGLQDQKITQAEVEACCKKYGVESIPLLAKRMDLIPQVAMDVAALIVSR